MGLGRNINEPGREQNTITSSLDLFGDPEGYSGMFKALGITCGLATQMLLDGFAPSKEPGILAPYTPEICDHLREKVEVEGIKLIERIY
jgi:saccharopine dehydrogenase (NADP+, L-glutamate forming)